MKLIKLMTAVALATSITLGSFGVVQASEQEQSLKTTAEVECSSTGAYGQDVDCKAKAEAEGKQKQVFRKDGTPVTYHKPVEAGLDAGSMAVVAGSIVSGVGAYVAKRKIA